MRHILCLLALFAPAALLAAVPVTTPDLRVFTGFEAGLWTGSALGAAPGVGAPSSRCLADPMPLLTGDRAGKAGQCSFTRIDDDGHMAVVTYRCGSGLSGRTALRRDSAGLFTIDAQGLEGGRPFASRTEWRRTGSC